MLNIADLCSPVTKAWRKGTAPIVLIDLMRLYETNDITLQQLELSLLELGRQAYLSTHDLLASIDVKLQNSGLADGAQQDEINAKTIGQVVEDIRTGTIRFIPTGRFSSKEPNISNGPNEYEQIVTNERGGKQHAIPVAYDCLDTFAMQQLGEVLAYGKQEYGADNWRNIEALDHINHAIAHLINSISLCKGEQMFYSAQSGAFLSDETYESDTRDSSIHTKLTEELTHAFARCMFALGVSE